MKRKILAMLTAVALCATCMVNLGFESKAENLEEDISYSELMTEDALVGYAVNMTRGVYYLDGHSIINKISTTTIGAGGVTNAAVKCKVTVNAIVEKLTSDGWARVTSWTTTVESGFSAMVSKSRVVDNGYYYRVRCIHYAASDRSSSYTNNLWM